MIYRLIILIACVIWTSSCAQSHAVQNKTRHRQSLQELYLQSDREAKQDVNKFIKDHLIEQRTFGYVQPYIPVVEPPVVRKVWIPDHQRSMDNEVLVAGHWVYIMLRPARWFIDRSDQVPSPVIVPMGPTSVKEG